MMPTVSSNYKGYFFSKVSLLCLSIAKVNYLSNYATILMDKQETIICTLCTYDCFLIGQVNISNHSSSVNRGFWLFPQKSQKVTT